MKYKWMIIALGLFAACTARERETRAHITQRRLDSSGKVMISYRFEADGKWVTDSVEVNRSVVVPHDSVKVFYAAGNPSASRLQIPSE